MLQRIAQLTNNYSLIEINTYMYKQQILLQMTIVFNYMYPSYAKLYTCSNSL